MSAGGLGAVPAAQALRPATLRWRRFRRNRAAVAGAVVLSLLAVLSLAAPLVARWTGLDPHGVDLLARLSGPSWRHPLGTDELGRDVLLRLLYGGRVSLAVGLSAAVVAALFGTVLGIIAGYRGGWLDAALMRLTDGVIALPLLPLLIVLAAVDLAKLPLADAWVRSVDGRLVWIIVIVALVGWTTVARLVRAATLSVRSRDHVRAAAALGAGSGRIMLVHILPSVAGPMIVATTLAAGNIILLESVLSFLGLGIQPPMASWGNMLTNAQEIIWLSPRLAILPGLCIFVTVIACNILGDGLQDALDPRAVLQRH